MNCIKCGAEIQDTMQVCPGCSLPLTAEAFQKSGYNRRTVWVTFFSVWNYMCSGLYALFALLGLIMLIRDRDIEVGLPLFLLGGLLAFVAFKCAHGLWHLRKYGRIIQLVWAYIWLVAIPIGTVLGILALVYFYKPKIKMLFEGPPTEKLSRQEIMEMATRTGRKSHLAIIISVVLFFCTIYIGRWAAVMISNIQMSIQWAKQRETMAYIVSMGLSLQDGYLPDNGQCPVQNGPLYEDSEFFRALVPKYMRALPLKDKWGNHFLVFCGEACNGQYGLFGCFIDDFLIVSYGKDGKKESWTFLESNPEAGIYPMASIKDFDNDLISWNGYWIRAPRENIGYRP